MFVCDNGGMQKIFPNKYPMLLRQISSMPTQLYCEGDVSLLQKKMLTVVGTRDISSYGEWVIRELLTDFLKELDVVVVSGLARGVDGYVHKVCIERGIRTLAVVPGGMTSVIPKANREIFEIMSKEELVVAEFEQDVTFNKKMFVLRNRLLAGISNITLVIEAGLASGSLITANLALNYNRDVYVIPGNINKNTSHGCNMLAKQGAGIVTSLNDLKELFEIQNDQVLLKF